MPWQTPPASAYLTPTVATLHLAAGPLHYRQQGTSDNHHGGLPPPCRERADPAVCNDPALLREALHLRGHGILPEGDLKAVHWRASLHPLPARPDGAQPRPRFQVLRCAARKGRGHAVRHAHFPRDARRARQDHRGLGVRVVCMHREEGGRRRCSGHGPAQERRGGTRGADGQQRARRHLLRSLVHQLVASRPFRLQGRMRGLDVRRDAAWERRVDQGI